MTEQKYPKLKSKEECAFPKRENCNFGKNYLRCPYMKYNNSKSIFDLTRWECIFKPSFTQEQKENQKKKKSDITQNKSNMKTNL
jgi:hypothetical protein